MPVATAIIARVQRGRQRSITLARSDIAAIAWTALFIGWLVFDWFGASWAPVADFILFAPLGLAVGVLQIRVAALTTDRRERLAWHLLSAAAFSRFVSGSVWGLWVAEYGSAYNPPWLVALASAYLVFGIAALLAFPSAVRRPVDRLRFRLDGAIVVFGSILVLWFFALGPFFRASGALSAAPQDYLYTIGDSVSVVVAAVLCLRSSTVLTRTVGVLLLLAFTLQVIPDIVIWSGKRDHTYHAGDAIAGIWYAVWALKWIAARYALSQLREPNADVLQRTTEYRSGALPYAFLAAAMAVLFHQLVAGSQKESAIFLFGAGSLAALLVARQAVELREREHLHQRQLAEEAWYRVLFQHAYDFVALVDIEGKATYVSPATARLLGDTVDLSRPWGGMEAVHPDDVARLKEALTPSPFHAASSTITTCRVRDASGAWRELSLRLQDLTADPLVRATVVNGHDVTRESRLTQRLRESEEVEALGIFAGGLAHDLNNILTVISSHVDLLQSESVVRGQARADLRDISVATKRATTLTRGLLALSRRKTSPRQPIDIAALVRERLDAHRATRDWPIITQSANRTVRADSLSLSQVVDALLDAAALGREPDEGAALQLGARVIDASAARDLEIEPGTYVVLRVGRALAEPAASRTPRALLGSGPEWETSPDDLGMLMAFAAVREAGGTLTVEGVDSQRCFSVYLPSAAA